MPLHEAVRLGSRFGEKAQRDQIHPQGQPRRQRCLGHGALRRKGRRGGGSLTEPLAREEPIPAQRIELRSALEDRRLSLSRARLPVEPLRALFVGSGAGGELREALDRIAQVVLVRHPR